MIPPHDLELEKSLLGCLLLDPKKYEEISGIVTAESFYSPMHQHLFAAIEQQINEGGQVDPVTVLEQARKQSRNIDAQYILQLAELPTAELAERYALRVQEKANRRKVINDLHGIIPKLVDENIDLADTLGNIEKGLQDIQTSSMARNQAADIYPEIAVVWEDYLDNLEGKEPSWLPTGFFDLDRIAGGLMAGEHILIGARPSLGKTSLALCLTRNVARQGKRALFFTLEQTRRRVLQKLISQEAKVSHQNFVSGRLTEVEKERVRVAMQHMHKLQAGILDGRWSVPEIRRRAIQEMRAKGLDLVLVDFLTYLQKPPGKWEKRTDEIMENTKQLQELGIELEIPIITMAQLNREVERRPNRRPILSDLREAGEEYADKVMFIYRDDYYNPDSRDKGIAEIIIAKNRDGPVGTVQLAWLAHATVFENLGRER